MYPDFIQTVDLLRKHDLSQKGLLVSNGFGLLYTPGLIDDVIKRFSAIKMTIFGLEDKHDDFVRRQGHFKDIQRVSDMCIKKGFKVIWQLMLTSHNQDDLKVLESLGSVKGVT